MTELEPADVRELSVDEHVGLCIAHRETLEFSIRMLTWHGFDRNQVFGVVGRILDEIEHRECADFMVAACTPLEDRARPEGWPK